jgi:RNA-directed DNA polymerase
MRPCRAGDRAPVVAKKRGNSRGAKGRRKAEGVPASSVNEDQAGVPQVAANLAGEVPDRWSWVERDVWTERMLTTLEAGGPKGGKWYSLIDKVSSQKALHAAFLLVKRNGGAAGVDHETIRHFEARLDEELSRLGQALLAGTYRPQLLRREWIPKPGQREERRPLGIPTVRDRVVQAALKIVLEPIFEPTFHPDSYGFRPQRGARHALTRVARLLNAGCVHVVDVDFRKFFDSIPHDKLLGLVAERISDGRVLDLLKAFLEVGVLDGDEMVQTVSGTPQGGVISPLLANIYLNGLDHCLARHGFSLSRYADDFVVLCTTATEARTALTGIENWAASMGLSLHPEKTRIVDMGCEGAQFDFLGFRFKRYRRKGAHRAKVYRFVRDSSLQKVKDHLRPHSRRNLGVSLDVAILRLNRVLQGWFQHFRSAHASIHKRLDEWVRRRLRSMLRRRRKRKGISRGADHQRWPNAFFADCGLFSLLDAHKKYVSPYQVNR